MREIRMPSLSAARAAGLCLMAAARGPGVVGWALMEPLPQAATPAARAGVPPSGGTGRSRAAGGLRARCPAPAVARRCSRSTAAAAGLCDRRCADRHGASGGHRGAGADRGAIGRAHPPAHARTAGQRQRRTDGGGASIKPFSRQNACFCGNNALKSTMLHSFGIVRCSCASHVDRSSSPWRGRPMLPAAASHPARPTPCALCLGGKATALNREHSCFASSATNGNSKSHRSTGRRPTRASTQRPLRLRLKPRARNVPTASATPTKPASWPITAAAGSHRRRRRLPPAAPFSPPGPAARGCVRSSWPGRAVSARRNSFSACSAPLPIPHTTPKLAVMPKRRPSQLVTLAWAMPCRIRSAFPAPAPVGWCGTGPRHRPAPPHRRGGSCARTARRRP